jgi:preprotein translocase subunit SecE
MSKQKALTANSLLSEIFHAGLYKPSQGRITRQVTCLVLWGAFLLAAYSTYEFFRFSALQKALPESLYWTMRYALPVVMATAGVWASYRLVNYARFADFLIAVEAEMNKVSWPSKTELIRSALVVIFVIFFLAIVLFGYDLLWKFLFREVLGILA